MYPIVAPSILAADFSELAEQIKIVEDAGAKILHLDIMDGHFVPNISFGPEIVSTINKITNLPLDVHLMIDEPIRYISQFVKSGADNITIHVEACKDVLATLNEIKNQNIKASISFKPNTSVSQIEPYLNLVDMVLVMSVEPGFGGQSFIESSLEKVKEIKNINPKMIIEIDGGIDLANASRVVESGVHILVAGNAIFKSNDIAESFYKFKNAEIKNEICTKNVKVITPFRIIEPATLIVSKSKIDAVGLTSEINIPPSTKIYDCKGMMLTPGFIDLLVHGGGGFGFADDSTESLKKYLNIFSKMAQQEF